MDFLSTWNVMVTLASEHNVVLADFHRLKLNHDTPDAQNKPVWEEANLSRMHLKPVG